MIVTSLLLTLTLATAPSQGRTRLRPPDAVKCDRNQLTAHSGTVTQWSRDDSVARLNMNTDAETKESFTVRFEKGTPPEKWFLLGGEVMRPEDWNKVESARGRLRPGIQATVWICQGTPNPVIDWRLPPK